MYHALRDCRFTKKSSYAAVLGDSKEKVYTVDELLNDEFNSRTIQKCILDGSALAMMKAGYTRDELKTLGYAPRLLERCAHQLRTG